jgi:hypothetical protein
MKLHRYYFNYLLLFLLAYSKLTAQTPDYFLYPQTLSLGEYSSSLGLSMISLPEDQTEEASTMVRAPLLHYQALYGLPSNFQIYGAAYTNLATFHFSLGPKWGVKMGIFALALGLDIAYWFGELQQFGFQSKIRGWIAYPNLTIGMDFSKFAVSLKGELINLRRLTELQDDVEISSDQDDVAGGALGIYIEQPLWKNNYVLIGFKLNYTKFYYPTWALYTTFNRYLYIPEFVVGFNL